jgi:hypothetical protein
MLPFGDWDTDVEFVAAHARMPSIGYGAMTRAGGSR